MADSASFLGIDLNAFGLALVLQSTDGETIGGLRRSFGDSSGPGEHDPQDWWRGVRTGVKELLRRTGRKAGQIRAIGLSGLTTGCVALDDRGRVIFPALIGGSPRLEQYADELIESVGLRNLRNLTGTGAHIEGGCMAAKLLAIRHTAPRVWHDLSMVLLPRDYLRFRMTGEHVTDPSSATRTLLFSPRNLSWSKQVLERIDLRPDRLPTIAWGNRITGRVSETAARETGLVAGTPVVTGGGHQASAAIAVGAIDSGDMVVELGSTGSVTCITDSARRDLSGLLNLGCHCLEGLWTLEHHNAANGAALNWLMKTILPNEVQSARRNRKIPINHFCDLAEGSQPGAGGLVFLPPDHTGHGTLKGLSFTSSKGDLVRSAMESAVQTTGLAIDQCRELGVEPTRLVATGPGAKTTFWPQLLADATSMTVDTLDIDHLCASGVCTLASAATGAHGSITKAITKHRRTPTSFEPDPDNRTIYEDLRQRLRDERLTLDLPS